MRGLSTANEKIEISLRSLSLCGETNLYKVLFAAETIMPPIEIMENLFFIERGYLNGNHLGAALLQQLEKVKIIAR